MTASHTPVDIWPLWLHLSPLGNKLNAIHEISVTQLMTWYILPHVKEMLVTYLCSSVDVWMTVVTEAAQAGLCSLSSFLHCQVSPWLT